MSKIETAKKLFDWNVNNLVSNADLQKNEIATFFAQNFKVHANGRTYEANYDNYYEFLNKFRSDIQSITYTFGEFIESENHVTIPLTAFITRTSGKYQIYDAILILKFNEEEKITLWHEVYIEREESHMQ